MRQSGNGWIALVGPSELDGKKGIGGTPVEALRAFNRGFCRMNDGKADGADGSRDRAERSTNGADGA